MNFRLKSLCLAFAFAFSITSNLSAQSEREIDNLKAFAKAYGYVKYFHPSTEAAELDWGWFAVYGAQEVLQCQNSDELNKTLNRIFKSIAPTVVFSADLLPKNQLMSLQTPENKKDYLNTYWQHYGVGKDMVNPSKLYKSVRVNAPQEVENSVGFGGIGTQIDAKPYLGKRIRLSGKAKLASESKGSGHLWMRVDNADKSPGFFNNMEDSPIRNARWASYSFEGEVGEKAKMIYLGGFLKGQGALFVDELELAYEENGAWHPIEVKNGNFENSNLSGTDWATMGGGVEIKTNSEEKTQGASGLEIRFKDPEYLPAKALFDTSPAADEFWIKELSSETWINMPLSLYSKDGQTFPKSQMSMDQLIDSLETNTPTTAEALEFRIGNLINAWNVFQHFYPYFEETGVDWEAALEESLLASFQSNEPGHLNELKLLTAKLKDNHVSVFSMQSLFFAPPIRWEWIKKQLLITQVLDPTLNLKVGDQVEEIEGQSPEAYFAKIEAGISAASNGWLSYRAGIESLLGLQNSTMNIQVEGESIALTRDANYYQKQNELKAFQPKYRIIEEDIIYLNLDLVPMDTINLLMPQLEKSRAIIADLRGYPTGGNHQLIQHLLSKPDKDKWMEVAQLIYPDQEEPAGFTESGWDLSPTKPYLGAKKIIFITDAQAVSYAESYMGFIEAHDLATIVGQPTSGTNGNINQFDLPGGYRITFTGMRVVKHDGSKFHGVGILPDVYVEKTTEGVKAGTDEFLEMAIKLAKQ
ncbi:hypothetical protein GCM10009119_02050 [Algoriphagus jejuensis]|uniref:Tail specific protease domain-containing protein n=1 Tax=Algoriphagus jejuensis TaxID=419934 RepID=A0ABN1MVU7_9BACT